MQIDEGVDVGLKLPNGGVNTSLDLLSGELCELRGRISQGAMARTRPA